MAATENTTEERNLEDRVKAFLSEQRVSAFTKINVETEKGVIVLSGKVPGYFERLLCLNRVQKVPGVRLIVDKIQVE